MNEINFNLLEDSWIPCETKSNEFKRMSIKDVIFNADEILEISSDNPLIVISIYRLLLAILHRNFGPKNKNEWKAIYKAGKWDKKTLEQYFKKWFHKFELFNEPEHRFYQNDISKITKKTIITKLNYALSSGHNTALFDHSWDSDLKPIRTEDVAQLLIAFQNYSLSGLGGFLYIEGKRKRIFYSYSPLISGIIVFLKGRDVFETLMLNFIRYDQNHPFAHSEDHEDIPFWERKDKSLYLEKNGRFPYGYLDYLTWQSRRLWLIPDKIDGEIKIKYVYIAQGEKLNNDWNEDPQKVYKLNEENKKVPIKLNPDKQVWRDAEALLRINDPNNRFISPRSIDWVSTLITKDILPISKKYNLEIFGLCNDPSNVAKIISWHRLNMPLPLRFLEDQSLVDNVKSFLEKCEEIERILTTTVYFFGKGYLFPDKISLNSNQRNEVNNFIKNYQVRIRYWNLIENYFYKFLEKIAKELDFEKRLEIIKNQINENVIKSAQEILNSVKINIKNEPRALKPYIQNSGYFFKHVYELKQKL